MGSAEHMVERSEGTNVWRSGLTSECAGWLRVAAYARIVRAMVGFPNSIPSDRVTIRG
jgi:hypothetical protein